MNNLVDKFNSFPLGHRVLGLVFIFFAIAAASYFLVFDPIRINTENRRGEIVELQRKKETLTQLKNNRAEVLAQLEQLKRQLVIAQEKLPKSAEIPSLLQRIHNQAKTAGLEIRKFQRNPDIARDFYMEIPVDMELNGTFDELANFFYYVSRMTRIVNVSSIGLKRTKSGLNADGALAVTARATTFRFKSESEMQAGGGKKK